MTGGLWRDTEFAKLWAASTVSSVGFHVTVLAMQLTAAGTTAGVVWLVASPIRRLR
jgi:hypothetical protein